MPLRASRAGRSKEGKPRELCGGERTQPDGGSGLVVERTKSRRRRRGVTPPGSSALREPTGLPPGAGPGPLLLMDMADRHFLMQDSAGHLSFYPIHAYVSIMLTPIR